MRAPRRDAEATRRRLIELGVLRTDLEVARDGQSILFPVADSCGPRLNVERWDFEARERRAAHYADLLPWPPAWQLRAPVAFEQVGDIVVVKVPRDLVEAAAAAPEGTGLRGRDVAGDVGEALRAFHKARAAFADGGVQGEFRTRTLTRIAGTGEALTRHGENGVQLWVDLGRAYFSPRLAHERAREAALVMPGEHVVDLFAGVAPFAVQAAKAGATVDAVDLNPEATALAVRNAADNRVSPSVRVHTGDARAVARALAATGRLADRVAMNLPHGAKHFLDAAAVVAKPTATLHYHEILAPTEVAQRGAEVEHALAALGWRGRVRLTRVVRNYSPQEAHVVFDLVGTAAPH